MRRWRIHYAQQSNPRRILQLNRIGRSRQDAQFCGSGSDTARRYDN